MCLTRLIAIFSWANDLHLTQKLLTFIEDCDACHMALKMSKGDGPDAGKHDEKNQTVWFKEIGVYVLKEDESRKWADVPIEKLVPIIRNRVTK
jgi:hypothetical protein